MSLVSAVLDGFVRVGTEFKTLRARKITAGTGLTGGGTLAADVTLALSAGAQASLARADTSLQQGDPAATGPQGPPGGFRLLDPGVTKPPADAVPGQLLGYRPAQ
jgi:hypothetical protein